MNGHPSTNSLRELLVGFGAEFPGKRAVTLIAKLEHTSSDGGSFWILLYPEDQIEQAVKACADLEGEDSYEAFTTALGAYVPSKTMQ